MKARSGLLTLGLLLALAQGAAPAAAQSAPGYRIGIDDVLSIYVWDNKDTDQTVFVRPDGKISLPLAGEVEVRGMTVAELETRLTELYQRTIKAARVTVIVKEIRSRPIFFIGGVGRTGPMQLTQDWTLLQAVSAAGGLLPQADLEAARVGLDGAQLGHPVHLDEHGRSLDTAADVDDEVGAAAQESRLGVRLARSQHLGECPGRQKLALG